MGILNVLVAAIAAFAVGAVWYGLLAEPWKKASCTPLGPDGKPTNASKPMTYITAFLSTVLVAGMMRHIFALSGIDRLAEGFVGGLGIGLFLVTPWIGIH